MKKILLVIDMQNDFISEALGSDAAKSIVPGVVELINGWDGQIIATLDTHGTSEEYPATLEGKYLPVYHCGKGTHGWEIAEEVRKALEARPGYVGTIEKPTFGCIALPEFIRKKADVGDGTEVEFTLIGLDTDICVVSNALLLRANFPNSEIRVVSSCCAGSSPAAHDAALQVMRSCQIQVI